MANILSQSVMCHYRHFHVDTKYLKTENVRNRVFRHSWCLQAWNYLLKPVCTAGRLRKRKGGGEGRRTLKTIYTLKSVSFLM